MERIKYFDFDILIERVNERYRARVIQSPAGQASAEFVLPFTDQDIEILMLRVGRARRGVRRIESPEMQAAKQFGGKLFDAVFAGDVRGALRSSVDSANREGAGLRVRLRLADAPELVDLPWEFLYNVSLNRFLTLSNKTPLVRYIELPETPRPLKVMPPLRVLVMISSPSDYEALDVEREWQNLNSALSELTAGNLVTLERLDNATLGALRRKLRQGQYHVLQFIGHGGFDAQAQDGVLILEDEQGRGRRASGQYLGTVLTDHDSLRLVVLNACEGGRTARNDPFAGVAQSLVQQGIPAVIAMQFEVTDEAAIIFAHEFYSALADGYPVDAALGDARGAIFAQVNDLEWGTPVLYLRAPDGMIFAPLSEQERAELERTRLAEEQRVREAQAREQERLAQEQRAHERQQQIETLYLAAKADFEKKDFDAAEKSIAALFALDATNANARALQTEIQAERERIARERAAEAARIAALTAIPERAPTKSSAPPSEQAAQIAAPTEIPERTPAQAASALPTPKTIGANRMLLIGGGFAALLVLLLGGAYALGVFNPRTPALTPPPNGTFLPPTVPAKGGGILPTPVTSPQIGTIEQRGNDNAEMVFVPAGEFLMGSGASEPGESHDKPQHTVILDAFWIDRHEVTIAQYSQCVDAGKCKPPDARHSVKRGAYYGVAQFDNYPVIDVAWADAQNYCAWAGKHLPTEAEWEKAARGTDGRIYPWGNDFEQSRVNNNEVVGDTTEVGSYPNGASPYGALDMAGNVWEYVNDWYGEKYYSNSPRTNPTGPTSGVYRVRRGGAMLNAQNNVRAAERNAVALDYHDFQSGFRCAQSAQTASETSEPQAGTLQNRGTDNAEMVFVPEGKFTMGSNDSDSLAASNEKPQHTVSLDAFWIDKHEVTNAQYKQCTQAGACLPPESQDSATRSEYHGNGDYDYYPIIYVSWEDAHAYCVWAGKRLPTGAEWEKAARGTDGRLYPWGNEFDQNRVNNNNVVGDTTEVGNYSDGASPYGALDMAGNVWEWVSDWYNSNYYSNSPSENPQGPSEGEARVLRGGAWSDTAGSVRAAGHNNYEPAKRNNELGFRCAQ